MAPRKPKPDDEEDDASSLASEVLKPKTAKAKVTKPKADKPKADKVKVEKVKKEVVKKEKPEGEKVKKTKVEGEFEKIKKDSVKKDAKLDKDGKEKIKAVTGEEAMAMMLAYLKEQNRPYSATEVSANLHGKVTKTVADKLLKEMENSGQIVGKATKKDGGGQWVFWTLQDAADSASPEELLAMDAQIATIKESLPTLRATLKSTSTQLATLRSAPTTAELADIIQRLQVENLAKKEKLQKFKDGSIKMVTKEELDRTEKEFKYWAARRTARKIGFQNLEEHLLEGLTREEIWEKAGIEVDPYVLPK